MNDRIKELAAKSGWRVRDEGGDQYKEYDDDELLQKVIDYKQAFCEKFPGYSHLIAKPFKIISLMHFS